MFYKFFWFLWLYIRFPFFDKVGFPSYFGPPIFINRLKNIQIGNRVRIFPGARIESVNKDAKIIFEDNITIGQRLHLTCGNHIEIGAGSTLTENVMVTDIDHEYREIGKPIFDQKLILSKTIIGKNCFIGYNSVIMAGTKLGKQCIVGANSVVMGDFPDYSVLVGSPAKIVKKYNSKTKKWEKVKY